MCPAVPGKYGYVAYSHAQIGYWNFVYQNDGQILNEDGTVPSCMDALGMKFGLWIRPEMVNEDSDLYRKHPDWAFQIPGRRPCRCRDQLVLDFLRKEVVDHVFSQIVKVLDSAEIEYIKMDMNRSLCDIYTWLQEEASGCRYQNCGKIMHNYVLGVYDFMERLAGRYPHILMEGCSGGGERFDAGMLYDTPQIWYSLQILRRMRSGSRFRIIGNTGNLFIMEHIFGFTTRRRIWKRRPGVLYLRIKKKCF